MPYELGRKWQEGPRTATGGQCTRQLLCHLAAADLVPSPGVMHERIVAERGESQRDTGLQNVDEVAILMMCLVGN